MKTFHKIMCVSGLAMFGTCPYVQAAPASDNAGNAAYADGWQDGDNGGTGFMPWVLTYSGIAPANHSDHFIDTAPLAGNSLGAPAFGLTDSGRPFFFDTSSATRDFVSALGVGETFKVDVDSANLVNGDPNGFSKGNVLKLKNSAGDDRFSMFTNNAFANDNWVVSNPAGTGSGIDTGIAAGAAFSVTLTLTGLETYSLDLTPVGGGASLFSQSGTLETASAGTSISRFLVNDYGTGSAADGSSELFFNNLAIVPEPTTLATAVFGIAGCTLLRRRGSVAA